MERRLLIAVVSLAMIASANAATYHVTETGSGAMDGSDWNNAYAGLPATLERGAVYYIANGNYGGYTFNTPVDSTKLVTIKKATIEEHGTEVGWNDHYADLSIFTNQIRIATDYWIIDGGYEYGFLFKSSDEGWIDHHYISCSGSNLIFRNIEIHGPGAGSCHSARGIQPSGNNLVFEKLYVHDFSAVGIRFNGGSNSVIDKSKFEEIYSAGDAYCQSVRGINVHHEQIAAFYNSDMIVKNSFFSQIYSGSPPKNPSGGFAVYLSRNNGYIVFYNNVFFNIYYPIILNSDGWGDNRGDFNIYGNTFVGYRVPISAGEITNSKNNIFCNLVPEYWNSETTRSSSTAGSHNLYCHDSRYISSYNGASDSQVLGPGEHPFKDYLLDWELNSATKPGIPLPEPYNVDMLGNIRGADGVWDRGAFEFVSGQAPPPDATPPIRANPQPTGNLSAGTASASVSLTTNEPATCRYSLIPGTSYQSMQNTFSATGGTSHSQSITGLTDGSAHNYFVRCIDNSGNANPDDFIISFMVLSPDPADPDLHCHAADTDCDGCISQAELMAYIRQWKTGNATLTQLMEAISIWKRGC